MKKIALLFFIMLLPTFIGAKSTRVFVGNVWYNINNARNNEAWVNANPDGIEKYAGHVIVPATFEYEGTTYTVRGISGSAFFQCPDLLSVTVGGSTISIQKKAFAECPNLKSVVIPDSILYLGDYAFFGCTNLEYITPPTYLTNWGAECLDLCISLKEFPLPTNLKSLGYHAFYECQSLVSPMIIPEGVTKIEEYSFYGCKSIPSITIPSSVTEIHYGAFDGCTNLKDIYCYAPTVPSTASDAFNMSFNASYLSQVTLHVPAASISAYQATEPWKNFKEIVALPDQNDYLPFVEDGKEWTMASLGIVGPEYQHTFSYQQIKLGSAIEVDGITFKQIVKSSWQYDQDGPTNWKETTEYVGEADGKVYIYNQQTKNTVQVMDFTLKVGDTYRQTLTGDPKNGGWDFVVTAVKDTVIATSADKTPRKCLHLSLSDSKENDDVWVEGIGSLYGGVQGAYGRVKAGAISMLRICKADEQTLYEAYHPFLKEGKTWNYQEYYHNLWDDEQWTKDVSYVINGTTEIDGKTYYKMYRISEEGSKYYCALREEDRKVWLYTSDDGDQLLYDFGMSVGDSYTPSDESIRYQLTAIKPMRFQYYQLLNVLHYDVSEQYDPTEPYEYIGPEQIVEGVGCEKGWNIMELYAIVPSNGILHGENFLSCYEDGKCIFTADDFNGLKNTKPDNDMAYRPFIEEGKVWKVGTISGNPVQVVDYYYFDGDTIIGGRTCKQMMRQRYVSPDYPEYDNLAQLPTLSKVGAWYEKDKKVYFYNEKEQTFMIKYDFSIGANENLLFDNYPYVIGPKQTGGLNGFKGIYRDVMWRGNEDPYYCTTWLEGVGGIDGPTVNIYYGKEGHGLFLMACTVGDEVIYLNEKYED